MPEKNIAWMQENIGDVVVSIGMQSYGVSCDGMLPPFFLAEDEDSVIDLSCTVDANANLGSYGAIFKRADLSIYEAEACDWVGSRPVRRPHHPQ